MSSTSAAAAAAAPPRRQQQHNNSIDIPQYTSASSALLLREAATKTPIAHTLARARSEVHHSSQQQRRRTAAPPLHNNQKHPKTHHAHASKPAHHPHHQKRSFRRRASARDQHHAHHHRHQDAASLLDPSRPMTPVLPRKRKLPFAGNRHTNLATQSAAAPSKDARSQYTQHQTGEEEDAATVAGAAVTPPKPSPVPPQRRQLQKQKRLPPRRAVQTPSALSDDEKTKEHGAGSDLQLQSSGKVLVPRPPPRQGGTSVRRPLSRQRHRQVRIKVAVAASSAAGDTPQPYPPAGTAAAAAGRRAAPGSILQQGEEALGGDNTELASSNATAVEHARAAAPRLSLSANVGLYRSLADQDEASALLIQKTSAAEGGVGTRVAARDSHAVEAETEASATDPDLHHSAISVRALIGLASTMYTRSIRVCEALDSPDVDSGEPLNGAALMDQLVLSGTPVVRQSIDAATPPEDQNEETGDFTMTNDPGLRSSLTKLVQVLLTRVLPHMNVSMTNAGDSTEKVKQRWSAFVCLVMELMFCLSQSPCFDVELGSRVIEPMLRVIDKNVGVDTRATEAVAHGVGRLLNSGAITFLLAALRNMSADSMKNASSFFDAGAVASLSRLVLVRARCNSSEDESVVGSALAVLRNLAAFIDDRRASVDDADAWELLFVSTWAPNSENDVYEDDRGWPNSCVECLVHLMRERRDVAALMLQVSRVLGKLSVCERIVENMSTSECISSLLHLLRSHGTKPSLCIRVCFTLANLVTVGGEHGSRNIQSIVDDSKSKEGLTILLHLFRVTVDRDVRMTMFLNGKAGDDKGVAKKRLVAGHLNELLVQMTRVLANLCLGEKGGYALAQHEDSLLFLDLLRCKDVMRHEELVLNVMSAVANVSYFFDGIDLTTGEEAGVAGGTSGAVSAEAPLSGRRQRQSVSSAEAMSLSGRNHIVSSCVLYAHHEETMTAILPLLFSSNVEIVSEAVRSLGNFSRARSFRILFGPARVDETLLLLMHHASYSVVLGVCGTLLNLTSDADFADGEGTGGGGGGADEEEVVSPRRKRSTASSLPPTAIVCNAACRDYVEAGMDTMRRFLIDGHDVVMATGECIEDPVISRLARMDLAAIIFKVLLNIDAACSLRESGVQEELHALLEDVIAHVDVDEPTHALAARLVESLRDGFYYVN